VQLVWLIAVFTMILPYLFYSESHANGFIIAPVAYIFFLPFFLDRFWGAWLGLVAEFRVFFFVTWVNLLFGFVNCFPLAIIRCLLAWVEWGFTYIGCFLLDH